VSVGLIDRSIERPAESGRAGLSRDGIVGLIFVGRTVTEQSVYWQKPEPTLAAGPGRSIMAFGPVPGYFAKYRMAC